MSRDANECVTIRCNVCSKEWCFFPVRVMWPPECDCGNKDSGNCRRDWPEDKFGNFTLVEKEILTLRLEVRGNDVNSIR